MIAIEWVGPPEVWGDGYPSAPFAVGFGAALPRSVTFTGSVVDVGGSPSSTGTWEWVDGIEPSFFDLTGSGRTYSAVSAGLTVATSGLPGAGDPVVVGATFAVTITCSTPAATSTSIPSTGESGRIPPFVSAFLHLPGGGYRPTGWDGVPVESLPVVPAADVYLSWGCPLRPRVQGSSPGGSISVGVWVTPTLLRVVCADTAPGSGGQFALAANFGEAPGVSSASPGPDDLTDPPYAVTWTGYGSEGVHVDLGGSPPPPEVSWATAHPERAWGVDIEAGTTEVLTFVVTTAVGAGEPYETYPLLGGWFEWGTPSHDTYTSSWPAGETWEFTVEVWVNTTPPPPVSNGWRVGVTAGSPTGWTCTQF